MVQVIMKKTIIVTVLAALSSLAGCAASTDAQEPVEVQVDQPSDDPSKADDKKKDEEKKDAEEKAPHTVEIQGVKDHSV